MKNCSDALIFFHRSVPQSILFLVLVLTISACHLNTFPIKSKFDPGSSPPPPDYSNVRAWASLPDRPDAADSTPLNSTLVNEQEAAKADVFFVYPTIFTGRLSGAHVWNADVNDTDLNRRIQLTTLLNQASVFNGACRIYVPYYRQAHLYAFYTADKEDAMQALELAYQDVRNAFEYYLKNYNHGRPIVIASHSQGSYHAQRLVKEFFDGKELRKQLVVAYLVGFPIKPDAFNTIHASEKPDEVGVWASWNTFGKNYFPENYDQHFKGALCTNPLLWNSSNEFAARELNRGGVGLHFTLAPNLVDAQTHDGMLWVNKPYLKGRWHLPSKSWHRADINFFYMNIRENVAVRIARFMDRDPLIAAKRTPAGDLIAGK
jgi:hypothetical protein